MVPRRRCELLRGRPLDLKHLPVPVEEVADARDLLVVHEPADARRLAGGTFARTKPRMGTLVVRPLGRRQDRFVHAAPYGGFIGPRGP